MAFFDAGKKESIAFRSDMDALPVTEATGRAFASRHTGCMHACGHDGHMAMLLEFAHQLSAYYKELPHNVVSVSYTHLDVYKRQEIDRVDFKKYDVIFSTILNDDRVPKNAIKLNHFLTDSDYTMIEFTLKNGSVDVYKRQLQKGAVIVEMIKIITHQTVVALSLIHI